MRELTERARNVPETATFIEALASAHRGAFDKCIVGLARDATDCAQEAPAVRVRHGQPP